MAVHVIYLLLVLVFVWDAIANIQPSKQAPLREHHRRHHHVSAELYAELEELARIVDISYCVGTTGIQQPFLCASRCQDFKHFELVTQWHTGPLLSDSCGYIAVSHPPSAPRIIVVFRGTYSVTNTIIDLSTVPQEYTPYPPDGDESTAEPGHPGNPKCLNCTVHAGFLFSWAQTRPIILPHLGKLVEAYPDYRLVVTGHSLGGAVAALAALDFHRRGWDPLVTTFGEPRIGNKPLMEYIDARFGRTGNDSKEQLYRRVTHTRDPVPLLPLEEWDYHMHGGEVYIEKSELPPSVADIYHCKGDEDPSCIAGEKKVFGLIPNPVLFAHRDYFWRLGLCVPGGDPTSPRSMGLESRWA